MGQVTGTDSRAFFIDNKHFIINRQFGEFGCYVVRRTIMDIISSNPYRILGVYSNSSIKERIANSNKLKAYLKVGKSVSFPLDLSNLIPAPIRVPESIEHANGSVNLPQDRLKYALFWFIKVTSIDEIALGYLQKGETEKAKELLEKKETFSSLINLGVLALAQNNFVMAIQLITQVIHDDNYRIAFVESVCGSTYQLLEDELARWFMDELLIEIPLQQLMQLFLKYGSSMDDNNYLKSKAIDELTVIINAEITKVKSVKNDDPDAQYKAGVALINNTKEPLSIIGSLLKNSDIQYQMIADNLAKQILQCGIDYYNNSKELDSAIKAMPIQKYALEIAVGALIKDRCRENVKILQKIIHELPPLDVLSEDHMIRQALEHFMRKKNVRSLKSSLSPFIESNPVENDLESVSTLLHDTKIELDRIKRKVTIDCDYYWKMTDLVVNCALSEVIEYVNKKTNLMQQHSAFTSLINDEKASFEREQTLKKLRVAISNAVQIINIIDKFDMTSEFKAKRYDSNKNTLINLQKQLYASNQSSNSGCMIWIIIAIGSIIAASCI